MSEIQWKARSWGVALALGFFGMACGDEIVYRDRPVYPAVPAGAGGFLGFSSTTDSRTVCGNCHSGKQAQWLTTRHAKAWTSLKNSGQQKPECEACHAVSAMGNASTDATAGWVATKQDRYQNVQCESCHGPGLTHVNNPDINTNKPLASIVVSSGLTSGCGECHSGAHRPFAEDWAASRHALAPGTRGTNASCVACHEAKGILAAWGVTTNYIEATSTAGNIPVTCVVCHDPHNLKNPRQLRYPVDSPSLETNLCMKCHYRRSQPEVASSSGPHSPQGPTLLGEAGWFPPNFQYPSGTLVATHGSDKNPRLCAGCHVTAYQVSDKVTGAFTFRATGHSFKPIPCVDAQGIPTTQTTCEITARSFRSCTTSGCHGSENAARSALTVARTRTDRLVAQIGSLLPTTAGGLPGTGTRIPVTEFSTTDNRISTGEGARFNMQLAQQAGAVPHNPFLVEALLLASLRQIEIDYALRPLRVVSMVPELTPPPGLVKGTQ
jgi:predicted CXXCH cytochrome family protein